MPGYMTQAIFWSRLYCCAIQKLQNCYLRVNCYISCGMSLLNETVVELLCYSSCLRKAKSSLRELCLLSVVFKMRPLAVVQYTKYYTTASHSLLTTSYLYPSNQLGQCPGCLPESTHQSRLHLGQPSEVTYL